MTYPTRDDMNPSKKKRHTKQASAKATSDRIFSLIVRSKGHCEHCGTSAENAQLQCAHWIGRTYSNIRTDFDNAFCLCASCHRRFTADPTAWALWALGQRGRETYDRLREAANEPSSMWWPDEVLRLREIAKREGVAA